MSPYRAALLGGLLYGLPLSAWLLGGLTPDPPGRDLSAVAATLPLLQVSALVLLLPALGAGGLAAGVAGAALLLMLPWPLLPVFWAAGVSAASLAGNQVLALVMGLLAYLAYRAAARPAPGPAESPIGGAVQVAALLTLWLTGPALFGARA